MRGGIGGEGSGETGATADAASLTLRRSPRFGVQLRFTDMAEVEEKSEAAPLHAVMSADGVVAPAEDVGEGVVVILVSSKFSFFKFTTGNELEIGSESGRRRAKPREKPMSLSAKWGSKDG